jgi:methionine-rich copper-binding protein CopC
LINREADPEPAMRNTLIAAAVLSLLGAVQADAHARLLKSDPKAGATVAAPKALHLSYSETIVPANSSVALAGADKTPVATGPIALDPKNKRLVVVPITAKLAPGAYRVDWSMTSADSHTMTGNFAFKVK